MTLGLIVASLVSLIPLVGVVISLFGMGGVAIAAWRMLRQGEPAAPIVPGYAPVGG